MDTGRSSGVMAPRLSEQKVISSIKKKATEGLSYRKICEFLTSVGGAHEKPWTRLASGNNSANFEQISDLVLVLPLNKQEISSKSEIDFTAYESGPASCKGPI